MNNSPLVLFLAAALPALAADPPMADREAILAMAGTHAVTFHFRETKAIDPGYEISPDAYDEKATEVVLVAEDLPTRISLQHLLVVTGKDGSPHVIKHWAQVWTWQDRHLLDYDGEEGDHRWNVTKLSAKEAAGGWSQLVTQTDDTPRYESHGRWVHEEERSVWKSAPTRRPLPRREYSKRDDYDHLLVTNTHVVTPNGWIHEQDNRKVVDREDQPARVLCREEGLNTYTRTESPMTAVAVEWWEKHHGVWNMVRSFWIDAGEQATTSFSYSTLAGGEGLSSVFKRLQEQAPPSPAINDALRPYLIIR